jgi:hypothetical protein
MGSFIWKYTERPPFLMEVRYTVVGRMKEEKE